MGYEHDDYVAPVEMVQINPEQFYAALLTLQLDIKAIEDHIGPSPLTTRMLNNVAVCFAAHATLYNVERWLTDFSHLLSDVGTEDEQ